LEEPRMHKSEKFWDRFVNNYDKKTTELGKTHIKTVEKIKEYINDSNIVLDFGCAAGAITNDIADNAKEIHGIDISSKMIQVAKRKAEERDIEKVNFVQSTIFDKKFKRESFDVILAFNVLHLLEDTQMVLQRINELLKSGGLIISSTACLGEKKTFLTNLLFLLTKIRLVPHINFYKISEIEGSIANGNFQIIETENKFQGTYSYFIVAKKIII